MFGNSIYEVWNEKSDDYDKLNYCPSPFGSIYFIPSELITLQTIFLAFYKIILIRWPETQIK